MKFSKSTTLFALVATQAIRVVFWLHLVIAPQLIILKCSFRTFMVDRLIFRIGEELFSRLRLLQILAIPFSV